MEVPKNSFACAICQKTFTNPLILIKHVEFRHSSAKPSQNSNTVPRDQEIIVNDNNQDPLETYKSKGVAPFEFVPIQETLEKNEVGAKKIMDSSSENPANGHIKIEDFNYEDRSLQIGKGNNENMSNTCAENKNNKSEAKNKTLTNLTMSTIVKKMEISKSHEHQSAPIAEVKAESNIVDGHQNSNLETHTAVTNAVLREPDNIIKPRILKETHDLSRNIPSDEQSYNGIQFRKCSVRIQKLPNLFGSLAKRMNKEKISNENTKKIGEDREKSTFSDPDFCDFQSNEEIKINSSNVKNHKKTQIGENPYSCKYCDKKFNESSKAKIHERIHTCEKPYCCSYCDKKFNNSSNFKKHERIHTGEKPYSCKYCDKRFTDSSNAKVHERIHAGEKP